MQIYYLGYKMTDEKQEDVLKELSDLLFTKQNYAPKIVTIKFKTGNNKLYLDFSVFREMRNKNKNNNTADSFWRQARLKALERCNGEDYTLYVPLPNMYKKHLERFLLHPERKFIGSEEEHNDFKEALTSQLCVQGCEKYFKN
jgi:hypothetical protein